MNFWISLNIQILKKDWLDFSKIKQFVRNVSWTRRATHGKFILLTAWNNTFNFYDFIL